MSVETRNMTLGEAFLTGAARSVGALEGSRPVSSMLDLQASGVGVDDDFSDSQAVFGFQSPPSSTSDDINDELSYQLAVQNTGGDGSYQIYWLTIT